MKHFLISFLVVVASACAKQTEVSQAARQKSFVHSNLKAAELIREASKFFEWKKGYSLALNDSSRGLIVTTWMYDGGGRRERFSLRSSEDVGGSIASLHAENQVLEKDDWLDVPNDGVRESQILSELNSYLSQIPKP